MSTYRLRALAAAVAMLFVSPVAQAQTPTFAVDLPAIPTPAPPPHRTFDPSAEYVALMAKRAREQRASLFAGERERAENGDLQGQYALGLDYLAGGNTPRDLARGVQWLTRAANGGSADAMYALGALYAGTGTYHSEPAIINSQKAIHWLTRAADAGNIFASIALAALYAEGKLVAKDETRAEAWYRRAAATDGKAPIFCIPPNAFTARMRKEALAVCAANHPEPLSPFPVANLAATYPPQAEFDLTTLSGEDRAALTQALLAAINGKLEAAYPPRALDNEVEGWGEVDCWWTKDGGLERCLPVDEAPRGYMFAKATATVLKDLPGSLPGGQPGMWSRLRLNWHMTPG